MKYVIMIMDGAADEPLAELGWRTPLQAASKKNIDALAGKSACGLLQTIPENFFTGSAVANLSILGYDPVRDFHGRGVLEAAAMGLVIEDSDVVFRCNTVCEKDGLMKSHSAGHISTSESAELISALNKKLWSRYVRFYPGVSYRHILVLKEKYSCEVECKPPHDYLGSRIENIMVQAQNEGAQETADLLRRLVKQSRGVLEYHPVNLARQEAGRDKANMIWPWSPGKKPFMQTFQQRFGLNGAVVSAVDLVKGLGVLAGFDVLNVEGATGLYNTNYEGKALACIEGLRDHDIVYLHVEAPDEASHEGDIDLKIRCIEDFDRRLVRNVLNGIDLSYTTVALLPDHPTSVKTGAHLAQPVPVLIYSPGGQADSVESFDEESCAKGSLGMMDGKNFIRRFLGR